MFFMTSGFARGFVVAMARLFLYWLGRFELGRRGGNTLLGSLCSEPPPPDVELLQRLFLGFFFLVILNLHLDTSGFPLFFSKG